MRILKRLRLYCSSCIALFIFICSVCAPVSGVQAQIAGNYTINSNQPTAGRNFNNFNDALIFLSGGLTGAVTVDVAPGSGPYNEQLFLNYRLRSSATKPLIFNCNGVTLTFLSTNDLARAGIKIDSVDYVTFDNLVVVPTGIGLGQYGVGFHLLHDADHNTIRNCTINNQSNMAEPQNNEGIVLNGSDDFGSSQGASNCDSNLIIKNTISGGNTGITMSSVPLYSDPPSLMKGNQVIDNVISDAYNSGVYVLYNDNTLIQGNDITGGPHAEDGTGITCFEPNTNMRIIGNRIHHFVANATNLNSTLRGINFGGAVAGTGTENLVANNLIYDFQSAGAQYGIMAQYGGSRLNIYHNTISLENHAFTGSGITYGIFTEDYSFINILNNIITVSRTTTDKNYAIYMKNAITTFSSNRNDLYVPSGSTSTNAVGYYGGTQTSLASWQTKTGRDLLSVSSDPKYTDAANFVLIPTDSAIDNMGQYAGINSDFTGAVRNNDHPDIGAYEFLTPACVGPVAGGSSTVLPAATVCEGSPFSLNLTANSFGSGQSYQWQTSSTINGTYANVGSSLAHPAFIATATTTLYYRAIVTCGTLVDYSVPVLLNVTPSLPAGTYTINSAQATGGNNFQSYSDALNAIKCGIRGPVVFNVAAGSGPYREQLNIAKINGVSAVNTVTFNGNGTTLVYLSTTSAERAVIKLNGANYFIFDNLTIVPEATTSGQYGVAVQMGNDADHNIIRNCKINMSTSVTSTDLVGICISPSATSYTNSSTGSYCDSNTVTGNTITGGNYGITCTSNTNFLTIGNVFTNNIIKDFRTYGIWISGTRNALVEGNDISRPTRSTNFNGLYAIYMDGTHRNFLVSKNKVHNPYDGAKTNTGAAYALFNNNSDAIMAEPFIVSNNLVYNWNGNGPHYGITNLESDSVQYYHNTISLEDSTSTATQLTRGFYQSSDAFGIVFKNNSIVIKRGGTGTKHCIYMNSATTTFESNYNNLLNAAKAGTNNFIGRFNGTDYAALNTWQQNALNDANSLNVYPNYQDPVNVDFTPTLLAMDNKGIPVGITTDIKGVTRHAKPDIGAFEFSICLPLGPGPVVTVDSAATNLVRFAWAAVTNATGYLVTTDGTNFVIPSSGPTGLTHTISGLTAGTDISLTVVALGTSDDCARATSNKITAHTICLQLGAGPDVKVDTMATNMVRFSWTAVANATGYKVSTDGVNYVIPSSGATGLTHTITGITAGTDVSLIVQAQGTSEFCPKATSQRVVAHLPGNQYFVPNTFTPNGNRKNDVFTVHGSVISTMRLMIFNQWGEKIFETSNQQNGWDGTYKGKQQPVGVYVYLLMMTLQDGTVVNKKGTINLIR
jgi:gliding motility-associated-like protein